MSTAHGISAPALYGLLLGAVFVLLGRVAPQPAGSVIWWTVVAGQLTRGAWVCWRRTGLPFATAAMALAAASSACLAALAFTGRVFPDLPIAWWIPVGFGLVAGPVCLLLESRVNQDKWTSWAEYAKRKSLWDILTARHIPQLRDKGA